MNNDRLMVALRVLRCIQKQQTPARVDIERLENWVSQDDHSAEVKELAYIVIRAEIRVP